MDVQGTYKSISDDAPVNLVAAAANRPSMSRQSSVSAVTTASGTSSASSSDDNELFSSCSSSASSEAAQAQALWQGKFLVEDDYVWTLSDELRDIAREELGETPELRAQGLAYMREFIRSDPRLEFCRRDANFLLRFLRMKKFNFEAATDTLEKYLRMRAEIPEWYQNLDVMDPALDEIISSGCTIVLPGRDFHGRKVLFHCAKMYDTQKFGAADLIRAHILNFETALEDEENQIRGFTYIFDFKDVSIPYISVWTPTQFHKVVSQGERFLPMRHQAVNLVNQPMGFFLIYEFAKHVLSDKIRSRMKLHRSDKAMTKLLPQDALPMEYGGAIPLQDMGKQWKKTLVARRGSVLGLDRMVVEFESAEARAARKKASWANLTRWFTRQKSVAATNEDVKAEWNSARFKVPPGLPFWLQAILALPGLPRIIQKFANEEELVNEFETYVEKGDVVPSLKVATDFMAQL